MSKHRTAGGGKARKKVKAKRRALARSTRAPKRQKRVVQRSAPARHAVARKYRGPSAPCKGNALMPACNAKDQQKILTAIEALRGSDRAAAERLVNTVGVADLCRALHGMRRWYTYNCWNAAKKVLPHTSALASGMGLSAPIGAYRGFKVDVKDRLARLREGDVVTIPVTRNGGCSSWPLGRDLANRFSGSPKGKVGLVIQLVDGDGVQAFLAPPEHCEPWFNKLYASTMGDVAQTERARVRDLRPSDPRQGRSGEALTRRDDEKG